MIDYMKRHERDVLARLENHPGPEILRELLDLHDKQILWMQHERMTHLITMLFVCLFFLLAFVYTLTYPSPPFTVLTALLLGLSIAYIFHYYRLENSVQRWYDLSNRIRSKLMGSK